MIELEEIVLFREGILGYKANLDQLQQQRSEVISIIQNLNSYHILRQEVRELQYTTQLLDSDFSGINEIDKNPLIVDEKIA